MAAVTDVQWVYLGGDPLDILQPGEEAQAVRREWWYDPSHTYVYQLRQPDGSWGSTFGEYEDEGYPQWVSEDLGRARGVWGLGLRVTLRVAVLTVCDLLGHCDPPFWPKWRYDDDQRLRWLLE